MARSIVANPKSFNRGIDQFYKRFEKKFKIRMQMLMEAAMVRLIRRTPVHTGAAVMSYVASVGQPFAGGASSGRKPVEATNKLALGSERLRGGAASVAMGTLARVSYNDPFNVFWITNNSDHIAGLESGELPNEPFTPRSPQGMFGVTLQEIIALLESNSV